MSRTNHHRGWLSEHRVGEALVDISGDEEVLRMLGISRIERIKHALPNSDLDKRHVDFLVLVELADDEPSGDQTDTEERRIKVPVPIQVKSSERKRREFEIRMDREKMPHIRSLAVGVREKAEHIKQKLVQCLRTALNMFRKGYRTAFQMFEEFLAKPDLAKKVSRRHVSSKEMRRRRRSNYFNLPPMSRGYSGSQYCCAAR